MSQKLAKSPELLRKEAEIKELLSLFKKKQSTLKRLKTRLQNMKDEIEDISRKIHLGTYKRMEELENLRKELIEQCLKLKKMKGMSVADKKGLQAIVDDLSNPSFAGQNFEEFNEFKNQDGGSESDFEEHERARMKNVFQEFQVKPTEQEQKDIRKVFLRLSQRFHPDLAQNDQDRLVFHGLMQQINEAYNNYDIQTLLELESMLVPAASTSDLSFHSIDSLQQEINRLNRDLQFIDQQIDRTSDEIKLMRQSEVGKMLTVVNKADREGQGLESAFDEMDQMIGELSMVLDGLRESVSLGRISPRLDTFLRGEHLGYSLKDYDDDDDDMAMVNELMAMMRGEVEPYSFFGDEPEVRDVENPIFPIGSSVRVKKKVKSPIDNKTDMKGWEGRLLEAIIDDYGMERYLVAFDAKTIEQMPAKFIKEAVSDEYTFAEQEFFPEMLQACPARDTLGDTTAAYRKAYHAVVWTMVTDGVTAKRIESILLYAPTLSDEENWQLYFLKSLTYPFVAKTRGRFHAKKGEGVMVHGYKELNDGHHFMTVQFLHGHSKQEYPLVDLKAANKKGAEFQILEDFHTWYIKTH